MGIRERFQALRRDRIAALHAQTELFHLESAQRCVDGLQPSLDGNQLGVGLEVRESCRIRPHAVVRSQLSKIGAKLQQLISLNEKSLSIDALDGNADRHDHVALLGLVGLWVEVILRFALLRPCGLLCAETCGSYSRNTP